VLIFRSDCRLDRTDREKRHKDTGGRGNSRAKQGCGAIWRCSGGQTAPRSDSRLLAKESLRICRRRKSSNSGSRSFRVQKFDPVVFPLVFVAGRKAATALPAEGFPGLSKALPPMPSPWARARANVALRKRLRDIRPQQTTENENGMVAVGMARRFPAAVADGASSQGLVPARGGEVTKNRAVSGNDIPQRGRYQRFFTIGDGFLQLDDGRKRHAVGEGRCEAAIRRNCHESRSANELMKQGWRDHARSAGQHPR